MQFRKSIDIMRVNAKTIPRKQRILSGSEGAPFTRRDASANESRAPVFKVRMHSPAAGRTLGRHFRERCEETREESDRSLGVPEWK